VIDDVVRSILADIGRPGARLVREAKANVNHVFYCDDDLVLRVGDHPTGQRRLAREVDTLGVLSRLSPLIPRVRHAGARDGATFQVLERLPGERLTQAWPCLDRIERGRLVDDLADLLEIVHGTGAGRFGTGEPEAADDYWIRFLIRRIERNMATVAAAVPGDETVSAMRAASRDVVDRFRPLERQAFDRARLHFDLLPNNILVQDGRLSGLIDFEMCLGGPRHAEFYKMEFFCRLPAECGETGDFRDLFALIARRQADVLEPCRANRMFDLYDVDVCWNMLNETVGSERFSRLQGVCGRMLDAARRGRVDRLLGDGAALPGR